MNLTRKAVVGWCLLACAAGAFPVALIGSLQPPVPPGEQQPLVPFEIRHAAGGAPGPLVSPDGRLTVKVVGDLEAQVVEAGSGRRVGPVLWHLILDIVLPHVGRKARPALPALAGKR
jgi:hypothetical protein